MSATAQISADTLTIATIKGLAIDAIQAVQRRRGLVRRLAERAGAIAGCPRRHHRENPVALQRVEEVRQVSVELVWRDLNARSLHLLLIDNPPAQPRV